LWPEYWLLIWLLVWLKKLLFFKVLFWGVMVAAIYFTVAAAYMIGQRLFCFIVNIKRKLPFLLASWASVAAILASVFL
jgi:hypothetical protein